MMRLLPVLIVLLAGCSETVPSAGTGMANPAAVHCLQDGGRLEYHRGITGTTGYCMMPDGGRVEEWRLYLRETLLPAAGPR